MQAIVYSTPGPPEMLRLQEAAKPTPKPNQVLIKVHAASINPMDCWRFSLPPLLARLMDGGRGKPQNRLLGADLAGQVVAVGSQVQRWQPGDEVFGIAAGSVGAFAEYACAAETQIARKPANLSFASAAAVPVAALTALQALRDKGRLQTGQTVLINGASGGVGTFAIQLAKAFGGAVTAVCSTRNVETAHALGADQVIDYTKADFTQQQQRYDLILAVNGYHSLLVYRRVLHPNGICVMVGGAMSQVFQGMLFGPPLSRLGRQQMGFMGIAKPNQPDLVLLADLLAAGKIVPVLDRTYSLSEAAAAINYLRAGHARGKVIFTIAA